MASRRETHTHTERESCSVVVRCSCATCYRVTEASSLSLSNVNFIQSSDPRPFILHTIFFCLLKKEGKKKAKEKKANKVLSCGVRETTETLFFFSIEIHREDQL
jgi:hypothetical protein